MRISKRSIKRLTNLARASDFTITEDDDNNQQQKDVSINMDIKPISHTFQIHLTVHFYGGDNEDSWSDLTYELYIELAQRNASRGFENAASHLICNCLKGISTGDIEEIETTWFGSGTRSVLIIPPPECSQFCVDSFGHPLPKEQRRSSIKGSAVGIILAQTLQDTLLYRLLADFAIPS